LHFFLHNSYHLARYFATILMKFAVSAMNLVLKWHFQVPFSNLGHACEHFMLVITGVWYLKFLCFYSKSLSKSSVLVDQSWGAAPMTTICNGWTCITALSLQSVRWLHSHAWAGFLFLGRDHGESPGPFFARHTCTRMALSMIHCVE